MESGCVECGIISRRVARDGYFFVCPLHTNTSTIYVGRVPQDLVTPRELQVILYLLDGLTNSEIGGELSLSPNYVRNVVSSILSKLNLENRRQIRRVSHEWRI